MRGSKVDDVCSGFEVCRPENIGGIRLPVIDLNSLDDSELMVGIEYRDCI